MLIKVVGDENPDHLAVAFDTAAPTFRKEKDATYKAGRKETPDLFRSQLPLIRQVLETLAVPILEVDGVEADDVIATLAERAAAEDSTSSSSPATGTRTSSYATRTSASSTTSAASPTTRCTTRPASSSAPA